MSFTHDGEHWFSLATDATMYTLYLIKQVATYVWLKLVVLGCLIPILTYDPDKLNVSFALLLLVLIDFATGIYSSWKTDSPILSRKVYRTAVKIVVYGLLVASARLIETSGLQHSLGDLDAYVIVFLSVTEGISVLENIGRAGYVIPRKLLNQLLKYRDGEEVIKSHTANAKIKN